MQLTHIKRKARKAGLLYLLVAIFGGFAHFFVRIKLIAINDPKATFENVSQAQMLFRAGFVADLVQLNCFVLLLLMLYELLKSTHLNMARTMFTIAIVGVPIASLNMLNQFAVLLIINNDYLSAFTNTQRDAFALFFLQLHDIGYAIAHIFFGLWLFPLGYLVYKSILFPKLIGILLMIATFGYLINMLASFLFPNYQMLTAYGALYSGLAEMIFIFWLLLKGIQVPKAN